MLRFMKKSRGAMVLFSLMLTVLLLAACGSQPASQSKTAEGGKGEAANSSDPAKKAEKKEMTVEEIAQYQANDREKLLLEGAKKEGSVTLYTSANVDDANKIVAAFEKKYGIKVVLWRGLSEEVSKRVIEEARAKRFDMDVTESNGPEMELITREKLSQPFFSPHLKDLSADAVPAHKGWVATRYNFFVMAYNTKKVKPEDIPKTYEDLLDPKWKGQIALEARDAPWYGMLHKLWGEQKAAEYFAKLAQQGLQARKGHTGLVEMISAGDVLLTLTAYNHNAAALKAKGAPIDWKPLDPAIAEPSGVMLAKNAKHPYAAMLLVDYMLDKDGAQAIYANGERLVPNKKVETDMNKYKYVMSDPALQLDEFSKWDDLYQKLFKK